ncbi:hypothetical protein N0V82_009579 [Gnomoniopsis sp. IMI 355080]|nr:hypothetical protein N0V82_009579 [Gnomoniopsis sp. IMI 355080]
MDEDDEDDEDAAGRSRARTTGPEILTKMTEALFRALVESRAIDHRRYPLFLPITLMAALPKLGMLYVEQNLTNEERWLKGMDDRAPIMRFKAPSNRRPFLSNRPDADASIVWAIWSECKTDLKRNLEKLVAKVFTVATEMVHAHLVNAMLLPDCLQVREWVKFVERLQRFCQGRVAWPSRLSSQRFCHFIFELLTACWSSQHHELARIQYLRLQMELQDASAAEIEQIRPLEGHGPLVLSIRAFLAQAGAAGSPWMLASCPDGSDEEEDTDGWSEIDGSLYGDSEIDVDEKWGSDGEDDDWKDEDKDGDVEMNA